jgi:D-arabinose 1-dehydrogenase-like Zn-dependent alcohol dehydrogenase
MKCVEIPAPGKDFNLVERVGRDPGPGEVRIAVRACGVCHSDAFVKNGHWPGLVYPRVPGHEVAGTIDALGEGVAEWAPADRVGVGWHGGHCGHCLSCRSGDFVTCANQSITGFHFDGGYEQYMIAPANSLARIPKELSFSEAAPLLCAGVTTFNSLRHSPAMPGDLVAVHRIGGLGHLALQFARQSGFRVAAISRGKDKEELALKLGAHQYIDTDAGSAASALARMGGARLIVATAPNSAAISELVGGLGRNGMILAIAGAMDPMSISPVQLIGKRLSIQGWPSGAPQDSEDTLNFCALTGVRPMIEEYPLEQASAAFDRMMTGKVRFRAVIVNKP